VISIKSICFIGAGLRGGGMERALTTLANHFSKLNFKVSVLLLFHSEHFFKLREDIQIIEPIQIRQQYNKYIYALRTIPYIRRNLKKINPDVVISYGEWINAYVILASRGLNYPLFISDRMSPLLHMDFLHEFGRKLLYKKASGIIAQTNYSADVIRQKTGARNIAVIQNPLHELIFPKMGKKNHICTLGRLSKEKGHRYLLEAFSRLNNTNWSLHIIGDGPERTLLEDLSKELLIEDRVIFYGHITNFTDILARAQIFVLPSLKEGYPNALIEAMSVPLACICSDCISGPADIIKHGENGLLVPPGDIIALTNSIDSLIIDPSMRESLAEKAFQIRERLDIRKVANDFLSFIGGENKDQIY
jgi:GalNAc-alpha-(1->4)-GalNAc-alpha-(1->3)-diNAcBac-PP-undecaprenol alpha-1,4-N-acetyl-D-galactosaminyltransferase